MLGKYSLKFIDDILLIFNFSETFLPSKFCVVRVKIPSNFKCKPSRLPPNKNCPGPKSFFYFCVASNTQAPQAFQLSQGTKILCANSSSVYSFRNYFANLSVSKLSGSKTFQLKQKLFEIIFICCYGVF